MSDNGLKNTRATATHVDFSRKISKLPFFLSLLLALITTKKTRTLSDVILKTYVERSEILGDKNLNGG